MNYSMISYVLGWIVLIESIFMTLPCVVSAVYSEKQGAWYLVVLLIAAAIGGLRILKKPKKTNYYAKEGFVIVALSWIIISIIGALPLTLSGDIPNYLDALFETASGFTTTGASILTDVEALSRTGLFWRSFTHWVGGMGVIVFLLIILPIFGGRNMSLMQAESPGPTVEKLVPHIKDTARILYGIYFVLTFLEFIFLVLFKAPVFDALTISFGTAGTGGFAIKNDSIGGYSNAIQNITTLFMILFGINFSFYFYIISRKLKKAFNIEEIKWYLGIILSSVLIITLNINISIKHIFTSLRYAFFQVGSIITTTGFATTDFNNWPTLSRTILLILMFVGACAGSTGGGIKVSRIVLLFKYGLNEIKSIVNPKTVNIVHLGKDAVSKPVLQRITVYFSIYIFTLVASILLISLDNKDLVTSFTSVAATLNNIGPGLNEVGPTGNYALFSPFSKIVLIFDMIVGRLELFPMFVLIFHRLWKKT